MKINYLERFIPDWLLGLIFLKRCCGAGERVYHEKSCYRGEAEQMAARLLAEQGEWLFLLWRGSSPHQLALAQENLVLGTAKSSSWRCRACGRAAKQPPEHGLAAKRSASEIFPGYRTWINYSRSLGAGANLPRVGDNFLFEIVQY